LFFENKRHEFRDEQFIDGFEHICMFCEYIIISKGKNNVLIGIAVNRDVRVNSTVFNRLQCIS